MSSGPPKACSLNAEKLANRLAEMRAIGRDALLSASPAGELRFRADAATRQRLDAVIAAESRCCTFLGFELREEADELKFTVVAPGGAEPVAADLVEAFTAGTKAA